MRLPLVVVGVCLVVTGCAGSAERNVVFDHPRASVAFARARADGSLWFLGGENPGSMFGRSGPLYRLTPGSRRLVHLGLPKPLWSVTGVAVSPDGRYVVVSNGGGEFPPRNLYVMRTDGTHLRQITHGGYYDADPAWSPDGRWIVFSSSRCCRTHTTSGNYGLYAIHPNGSGLQELRKDSGASDVAPAWSPEGARIAYVRWPSTGTGWSIWVMTPNGRHAHAVVQDGRFNDAVAWSPTGRELAYTSNGAVWQVRIVSAAGGAPRTVYRCSSPCRTGGFTIAWSPSGRRIAFTVVTQPPLPHMRPRIAIVDLLSGKTRLVPTPGTGACCLSWIPRPGRP